MELIFPHYNLLCFVLFFYSTLHLSFFTYTYAKQRHYVGYYNHAHEYRRIIHGACIVISTGILISLNWKLGADIFNSKFEFLRRVAFGATVFLFSIFPLFSEPETKKFYKYFYKYFMFLLMLITIIWITADNLNIALNYQKFIRLGFIGICCFLGICLIALYWNYFSRVVFRGDG